MRQLRSGVSKRRELSPERIAKLEEIGMIWSRSDYAFERNYLAAMEYSLKHGNLKVPAGYVCEDGFALGSWIIRLRERRAGKNDRLPLTGEQIARLDKIGMVWLNKYEDQWERAFREAEKWFHENGSLDVPAAHKAGGINLGKWICRQREMLKSGKLSPEHKEKLDSIAMAWNQEDPWEKNYREARKYYQEHGDLEVPPQYIDGNGSWLGRWVSAQRKDRREGRLSPEQADRLTAIGMRWQSVQEQQWYAMYKRALTCTTHEDSPLEPGVRRQLLQWYDRQCIRRQDGKLTRQQTIWLDDLEKPIRALRADSQGKTGTETTRAWQQ